MALLREPCQGEAAPDFHHAAACADDWDVSKLQKWGRMECNLDLADPFRSGVLKVWKPSRGYSSFRAHFGSSPL